MDSDERSHVSTHSFLRSRQLQADEGCPTRLNSLNTTYNDDGRVPAYVGIMFEVVARRDMTVLTFELDLIDGVSSNEDLSVEVYAKSGGFTSSVNDPNEWELLAETTAVLDPLRSRGAIVPTPDFRPLELSASERWSFYVTMQQPLLDHNVYALQKTGEVYLRTLAMDFYVGGGLTEYKFPMAIDTLVDPQFAGVVHYQTQSCEERQPVSTRVDYLFLMDLNPTLTDVASVGNYVNEAMDIIALENSGIQSLMENYDLVKSGLPLTEQVTADVLCPPTWVICPFGYVRSSVFYSHSPDVESQRVEYELYLLTKQITDRVRSRFERTNNVEYIGKESVSAQYSFTLEGVPRQETMDSVQRKYFANVMRDFLDDSLRETAAVDVLEVTVDDTVTFSDSQRRLQDDSAVISGRILGAYRPPLDDGSFGSLLLNLVRNGQRELLGRLKYERFRPGEINADERYVLFGKIDNVDGRVQVDDTAFSTATDDKVDMDIFIYIGIALGAVAVICLSVFGVHRIRKYRKYRREVEEYREQMRRERRQERQEQRRKKNSMLPSQRPPSSYKETDSDATPADSEIRMETDGSPDRAMSRPVVEETAVESKEETQKSALGPLSSSIASLPPTAADETLSEPSGPSPHSALPDEQGTTSIPSTMGPKEITDDRVPQGEIKDVTSESTTSLSDPTPPSEGGAVPSTTAVAYAPDSLGEAHVVESTRDGDGGLTLDGTPEPRGAESESSFTPDGSMEKFHSSADSSDKLHSSVDSFANLDLSGDEGYASFVAAKRSLDGSSRRLDDSLRRESQKPAEDEDSSSSSSSSSSSGSSSSSSGSSSSDDEDEGDANDNRSFGSLEGKLFKYVGRSVSKGSNDDSTHSFGDVSSILDDSNRGVRRDDEESSLDVSAASYRNIGEEGKILASMESEESLTDQPRRSSLEGYLKHQEQVDKTTPSGGQSVGHDEGQSLGHRSDEGPRRAAPLARGRARHRRGSLRSMSSMESIKKAASVMSGSRSPAPSDSSRERSESSRPPSRTPSRSDDDENTPLSMLSDIHTPSVIRAHPAEALSYSPADEGMLSPSITRGMWQLSPEDRGLNPSLAALSDPLASSSRSPSGSPNPGGRMVRTPSNRSIGLPFVGANPNPRSSSQSPRPTAEESAQHVVVISGLDVAPTGGETERRLSMSSRSSVRSGEITPFVGAKPKWRRSAVVVDTEGPRRQSMPLTTMRDDGDDFDLRDQFNRSLSYQGPWSFYTNSEDMRSDTTATAPLSASPSLSPRSHERPPTPPLGTPTREPPRSPFMPVSDPPASRSPRPADRAVHRSKSDDLYFLRSNSQVTDSQSVDGPPAQKGRFSMLLDEISLPPPAPVVSKPRGRTRDSHRSRSMDLSYTDLDADAPLGPLPETLRFPYGNRQNDDNDGLLESLSPNFERPATPPMGDSLLGGFSPPSANLAPAVMPPSGPGRNQPKNLSLLHESGHSSYADDEALLLRSLSRSGHSSTFSGHSSTFSGASTDDDARSPSRRRMYGRNESRSLHALDEFSTPPRKQQFRTSSMDGSFASMNGGGNGSYHGGFSRLVDDLLKESYPNGVPGSDPR